METKTKTYKNGMRLVNTYNQNTAAETVLISISTGSINENEKINGISHLIEHMLFKGTKKRTAADINNEFEQLGASINAFTTKYRTCFYASALTENIPKCVEILFDMIFNSVIDEEELEREKKVIYEEIDMYLDDASSVAEDNFQKLFFKNTKLESLIIGTKNTVKSITRQEILDYLAKYYVPENIIIAFAGGMSFAESQNCINSVLGNKFKNYTKKPNLPVILKDIIVEPQRDFLSLKKDFTQSHIIIGFPLYNMYSSRYGAYQCLSFILGGGMSSRLFTEVREKNGLAYSIFAQANNYDCAGVLKIALATNNDSESKAIECVNKVIKELLTNGITSKELDKAKTYLKTRIGFTPESTMNLARQNAYQMQCYNRPFNINTQIKIIEKVTKSEVNKLIKEIFTNTHVCGVLVSKTGKKIFNNFPKL